MILEACQNLHFPEESLPVLLDAEAVILSMPEAAAEAQTAIDLLMNSPEKEYLDSMQRIADLTQLPRMTVDMVVFLMAAEPLKDRYAGAKLPESLIWESLADLRYKLFECRAVHGIWGTFVSRWFQRFYQLERFKFGRLEYEKIPYKWTPSFHNVKTGDPVVNVHIPSAGPLTEESVRESIQMAWEFYRDDFGGIVPFECHSWMLYPPLRGKVFPDGSNIAKFHDLFRILEWQDQPENKDFWRVFNINWSEDALDKAPADTSLRRSLLAHLKAGGTMGEGLGVFVYDGEKFI